MNGRRIRNLILLFSVFVFLITLTICVYGIISTTQLKIRAQFVVSSVRSFTFLFFMFFYCFFFCETISIESVFIPLFLFFSMICEFSIIDLFSKTTALYPGNPSSLSFIIIFSTLMSAFSLLGFGFFYKEREQKAITRFILTGFTLILVVASSIPKIQNPSVLNDSSAFSLFVAVLYGGTATLLLKNLISDSNGAHLIRHVACLLFLADSVLSHYYSFSIIYMLVETLFMLISYYSILLGLKISNTKL